MSNHLLIELTNRAKHKAGCRRWLAIILVLLTVFASQTFQTSALAQSKIPATPQFDQILTTSWNAYKQQFIQQDGRVIDWMSEGNTTSEGQSYAMLRSVWMNDPQAFNICFGWTLANLRARNDNLFSWRWGRDPKQQSYGVLDKSSAADADEDIAVALILASRRWKEQSYLVPAREIIKDIWAHEVVEIHGEPYLVAGDWSQSWAHPVLNPSYLAPYAYRMFSEVDTDQSHKWMKLVSTSYRVIEESSRLSSVGLPPDWCSINRETGTIETAQLNGESSGDYSYDAWRVMWRLAADAQWYDEPRAIAYIRNSKFLIDYWRKNEHLSESFMSSGQVRSDQEPVSQLGIHLPAFAIVDKRIARKIYDDKLMASYDRLGRRGFWGNPKDYYGQNWAWMGIALYSGNAENYCGRGGAEPCRVATALNDGQPKVHSKTALPPPTDPEKR
jgi:endo-1,4-beta-D-glucanase Y